MNAKYKATAQLSSNIYNRFTSRTLSEIYNILISLIPFVSCKCTSIYRSDNTTVSANIKVVPKNLDVKAFDYFSLNFYQQDDYVTAIFAPDKICVIVSLSDTYTSCKVLAKKILKSLCKHFRNNYDTVCDKDTDINSTQKQHWYNNILFWTAFAAVSAAVIGITEIIVNIFNA